jgi:putative transposase
MLFAQRDGIALALASSVSWLRQSVGFIQGVSQETFACPALMYHLVWCPKHRRKVLVGQVAEDLRMLLYEKARELQVMIEAVEIMPDHVHLFVEADSTEAPQHLANQFKGYTSRVLRERYPALRSQIPSLWSRSYSVGSVGSVSAEAVKHSIENQKNH